MPVNVVKANRVFGIVVPVFELFIFVFSTYVVTGEICVNWLLRPPAFSSYTFRPGAAIAILVIHYALLLLVLISLLRTAQIAQTDPGFVPHPDEQNRSNQSSNKVGTGQKRRKTRSRRSGKSGKDEGKGRNGSQGTVANDHRNAELGLQEFQVRPYANSGSGPDPVGFYDKDAFICTPIGRPNWCDRCQAYKPDRAHHSSDVNRCVRGLDHFCPWAGGTVAENNHKFFIQFVAYTALYCTFCVITTAVFIAEQRRIGIAEGHTFVTMVILLAIAAFFGLFTWTMLVVHVRYAFQNLTTIEELQIKSWSSIAVYVGTPKEFPFARDDIISYPLPETGQEPRRTFAILRAEPNVNLFDVGPYRNWCLMMGAHFWDWLLPFSRSSPRWIYDETDMHTDFPFSPEVHRLKEKWLAANNALATQGNGRIL